MGSPEAPTTQHRHHSFNLYPKKQPHGGLRNLPSQPTHMTHQHVPAVQDTKWPQQDAPSKSVPFVRKTNDMPCLTLFGVSCKKNKMRNDLRANTPPPKIDLTGVGCTPRRTRCTLCVNVPLRCLAWIYRRPGSLTLRCIQMESGLESEAVGVC